MEALLSIKSSLLEVMGTNSVGLHGVECGEVETPNGSEGSLIHVEQRWAHTHMTLNADGDGETPESAAELRLQNSSLRAELKSTRSKLEHVQRQHELVRGQQRNQQRAASALQDRLQELEQGAALPPLSCEEEEKVQALEGALEEERGVTAVLLGRLIDNDAKIQEQQRQMEELQEQLAAQRAEAAAHEHKLKACLDDSLAVLQKENAAVARLETRLLSAEQALKREGGASSDGAPLRKADAEGELSEAGRAYLLDMQAQLIGLELQLGEERKKCAFMQRKAQETERELIQAGAEVQALQIALSAAGILSCSPVHVSTKSNRHASVEESVPEGSQGALICQQEASFLLQHVQGLVNSLPQDATGSPLKGSQAPGKENKWQAKQLWASEPSPSPGLPLTTPSATPSKESSTSKAERSHSESPEAALQLGAAATAAFLTVRPNTPGSLGKAGSPGAPLPHRRPGSLRGSVGTPLQASRGSTALHTFDPCLTDSEDDSSSRGSDTEREEPNRFKSRDLFSSPTTSQGKAWGRSAADGGPLLVTPLSSTNGGTLLPHKASGYARRGGPAVVQSLLLKGVQEPEAAPGDFTVKAHYGNSQPGSARTSSTLSSRIAMFESGGSSSEGKQVFHTPHKSNASPSKGWGGSSSSAASERAQDIPPVSVEEVRRRLVQSAMAQPPPSSARSSTPRTAPGEPQGRAAGRKSLDGATSRAVSLKGLQEKAASLNASSTSKSPSGSASSTERDSSSGGREGGRQPSAGRRCSTSPEAGSSGHETSPEDRPLRAAASVNGVGQAGLRYLKAALEAQGVGARPAASVQPLAAFRLHSSPPAQGPSHRTASSAPPSQGSHKGSPRVALTAAQHNPRYLEKAASHSSGELPLWEGDQCQSPHAKALRGPHGLNGARLRDTSVCDRSVPIISSPTCSGTGKNGRLASEEEEMGFRSPIRHGEGDEESFHTPISTPRTAATGGEEGVEASLRAGGPVKDEAGSPDANSVAGPVISPQRVGTALSEQEAADELDRFVQASCADSALDFADDHDVGILDWQEVDPVEQADTPEKQRREREDGAKSLEEVMQWAAEQQPDVLQAGPQSRRKAVPVAQNAIHALQQARNHARASGGLPPVPPPSMNLLRPDVLKARRWDKLRRWAARRNGNGGPLDTVIEDTLSETGSQLSSSSMQHLDITSFSVAASSPSAHSLEGPSPEVSSSLPSSAMKGVVSRVRKLVAVFERKELSASFSNRKELLLAAPPHKAPPATEASVAIMLEEHGRNMPSPGQLGSPVLRTKDIMGLPASRYNRKEELSAEELANHPILLRKSRLWDCIPGRVQTMDDNMSDTPSSKKGLSRLLSRRESDDILLTDTGTGSPGGQQHANDLFYSLLNTGLAGKRHPPRVIFIRPTAGRKAGRRKPRMRYVHYKGPIIVSISLGLPNVEANLEAAKLLSMEISPLRALRSQRCRIKVSRTGRRRMGIRGMTVRFRKGRK